MTSAAALATRAVRIPDPTLLHRASRLRRWTVLAGPPLVYFLTAAYLYSGFLANPNRVAPGGPDGVLYCWYFGWVEHAVTHLQDPFFSTAMNYPHGVNLMWNTAVLMLALLAVPLTATIGPVATVVILTAIAPAASATVCYFVLRRLTGGSAGAALASLLYGFGPFFIGQSGHLHLIFAVLPPLTLLLGHQLLVTQTRSPVRIGILLGVTVGLALISTEELVALTAVSALIAVLFLVARNPGRARANARHAAVGIGVCGVVSLLIAGVPLYYQLFGPQALSGGVAPADQRADIASFVRPSLIQYYSSPGSIAANLRYPANAVENTAYLGVPLIALIVVICAWLITRRDRFVHWWIWTTVGVVSLSLGVFVQLDGHVIGLGPWGYLARLPILGGAVPIRFSLITTLLVAYLLAYALAQLRGRRLTIGLVVVALALVPLCPPGRFDFGWSLATPRFFTTSAARAIPDGSAVLLSTPESRPADNATAMLWQLRAGLRFELVGGYSVFNVRGKFSYAPEVPAVATVLAAVQVSGDQPSSSELARARASLAGPRIDDIVIADGHWHAAATVTAAVAIVGCIPAHVADVTICRVGPR